MNHWMAADKVFNNAKSAGSITLCAPNIIKSVYKFVAFIRTYSPCIPSVTWSQLLDKSLVLLYALKSLYPRKLPWLYHAQIRKTPKSTQMNCMGLLQQHPLPLLGFPGALDVKESAWNVGDPGLIPGLGRYPGEGNDYPLQYSCLENSTDRRSLVGYSPRGGKESDMTEQLTVSFFFHSSSIPFLSQNDSKTLTLLDVYGGEKCVWFGSSSVNYF